MSIKVLTIYKQFHHKIHFAPPKDSSYTVTNLQTSSKWITKDQLMIHGNFTMLVNSPDEQQAILVPFEEVIQLGITNFDPEEVEIKVTLAKEPTVAQRGITRFLSRFLPLDESSTIRGQLCCEIRVLRPETDECYDILCIASTRWDYIWQRPHHLMERLSKKHRVLFFNHSFPVGYDDIQTKLTNPALWEERLTKVAENLWVFSAVHLAQSQTEYLSEGVTLQEFNFAIKSSALQYLTKRLNFTAPIIITYLGESVRYLEEIPRRLLCYDCIDDFSSFSWTEKEAEALERELIEESDIILASAEELHQRIQECHPYTFLLPNAVEFRHFAKAAVLNGGPQKLNAYKRPVIGFIGAFYEWVDEELLYFLATVRSEWSFVFIGPVQPKMGELIAGLPNVTFLGIKDYKELPDYLSEIDVCLIPFKLNSITRSANPIKMWEYLAAGKPIVATAIPEVLKLWENLYIGETKTMFLEKIEEALQENSIPKKLQRMEIAMQNDWNQRVEKLLNIIKGYEEGEFNENIIYQ